MRRQPIMLFFDDDNFRGNADDFSINRMTNFPNKPRLPPALSLKVTRAVTMPVCLMPAPPPWVATVIWLSI